MTAAMIDKRYRHAKGGVFRVMTFATYRDTGEELVIYQCETDGKVFALEIPAFEARFSPVDEDSQAEQLYRDMSSGELRRFHQLLSLERESLPFVIGAHSSDARRRGARLFIDRRIRLIDQVLAERGTQEDV